MTPVFYCCHCGRKIDPAEPKDFLFLAGALSLTLNSPLMDDPSPPSFVGGCCAAELGEWLQPALKQDEDYLKDRDRMEEKMRRGMET